MGNVSLILTNYFSVDDQLAELEIGKDVENMFKKCNMLGEKHDRKTFKQFLQIIRRKDLIIKLEIYLAAGRYKDDEKPFF